MKAHKPEMIAQWAKENGIRGYEHYDPRERNKPRPRKPKKEEYKNVWDEVDASFDR